MRTKRNNYFCVLIILLVLIEITSIFLMYKSSNNRNTLLDNVNLKEQIKEMKGIAIMLEQSDGTYKESSSKAFPTDMKFKASMSGCIDNLGNRIENAITYTNGVVNVTTSNTTYCYLYFGQETALDKVFESSGDDLWKSTLENDGYRFVGTNPDNYICFGTTSKSECTGNTDLYMYRIIGIFEDEDGKQHLKLIKKEALEATDWWHMDNASVKWSESDLNANLNGGSFLELYTYPYMQDTRWTDKISTWNYTATNTITVENYRETGIAGPEYDYETVKNVYLHEMNRSSKTSTIGEWETVSSKIGLMYVSDYMLSLGNEALNYTGSSNYETLKTGWMHLENNDSGAPSQNEWTISLYGGMSTGPTAAHNISSNGNIGYEDVSVALSTRPVFYLEDDTKLDSGTGSSDDPYIIYQEKATDYLIENVNSDILWDSTLEDDGYRYVGTNPDNYICFGTTDETECTGDTDKYMYRIIGIFEDSEGKQHLKLIKKEALNTSYKWNSDYNSDVSWENSDIYKGLNGISGGYYSNLFIGNTTYSYMQDTNWTNKIETWDYIATNTKTYENSGMNYYSSVIRQTYLHEMNRSTKTSTIGVWDKVSAKIGLMYVSDYQLSLGSTALDYKNNTSTHYQSMKTGWMHISNNDSGAPNQYEWTMSRNGFNNTSSEYYAWLVFSDGYVSNSNVGRGGYSIRPVFYLTSDVTISGEGKSGNPYIIS